MERISVNASNLSWEPVPAYGGRIKRKVLRTGPDGRPRAALIRLEPGFEMEAHSHPHAENQYVLEGMYESQGREYPAGSYHFIPRHAQHGPSRSSSGAVLFVAWED
jgi:quercetin dioxygenase-like cupin family protein